VNGGRESAPASRLAAALAAGALAVGTLAAATMAGRPAAATDLVVMPGGQIISKPARTLVDLHFRAIVRQATDVSCGAAALATLLTYYYGIDVDERAVIDTIMSQVAPEDREKIMRLGFSMLELKRAGERFGFVAAGFRIPEVANLTRLKVPVLTLINIRGYRHFVVLKGVADGRVYIADPAFGNRSRPLDRFADEWSGVILVLVSDRHAGRDDFTLEGMPRARAEQVLTLIDRLTLNVGRRAGEF
jgi:predicted double-glycine peptidase